VTRATRLRCSALILLSGVASVAGAQSGAPDRLPELFRQGAQDIRSGDLAGAEAAFRKATQLAPGFAPAWLDLGLAQLREGKLPEAITNIRASLRIDPSSPGARLFLGIAEYQSSHSDDAIADLKQAIQDNPKNEQAYAWLGIVEFNVGHPELAVGPLDHASELDPTDENVIDYRVQAHMAVAKQSYTELYKLDPASWRLHQLSAVIDAQADDHQHAIDEYLLAIKQAPSQPDLYESLGWEYRALNENDLAVQAFTHQLKLAPRNPIAMYNLASAEVENGQAAAAVPLLEHVVSVYGVPTQADYYLGRAFAAQGKYGQAAEEFRRATQLDGQVQLRAWYELSQADRHLGKIQDARAAVLRYEALREQSEKAKAANVQDFLKLNQANATAAGSSQQ
jgi:tetratricopeptide (TPR) repeat protein